MQLPHITLPGISCGRKLETGHFILLWPWYSPDWRTWPACACGALQGLARMWKISSERVFNSITITLLKDVSYPESGRCTEATRKILTATWPGSPFWRTPARLGHHLWPGVTSESGSTSADRLAVHDHSLRAVCAGGPSEKAATCV